MSNSATSVLGTDVEVPSDPNPARCLTPEVPDTVVLPAWLDPAGLAAPDRLEAIRAEAAKAEVDFIAAAAVLCDALRRSMAVINAAYISTNPAALDNDALGVPPIVGDLVEKALGIHRLEELQGWLTGWKNEGEVMTDEDRDAALEKFGFLVTWDANLRRECSDLVGLTY